MLHSRENRLPTLQMHQVAEVTGRKCSEALAGPVWEWTPRRCCAPHPWSPLQPCIPSWGVGWESGGVEVGWESQVQATLWPGPGARLPTEVALACCPALV